jgi:hypothetical protein
MKRAAWILTVLGILWMSAGAAQADWYHHGPHHGPYHHGYCGPVVARPPVMVYRPMVVPVAPPPPVVYQPVYPYGYYRPAPVGGIYYRGRGLSIGIGW